MNTEQLLAFISHAGEDKERFVIPFANKLLAHGVPVWVDKWEMLPGDSLVDKIFEEGIKNASAFIIILSKNSVQKKWVREELNAGVIKKISGKTKIIPVVIDDCEVPEALQSIVWEKIKDIENYEEELQRIVAAIHGVSLKPSVGPSPKYAQLTIDTLPGLSKIDMLVLKASCENSIEVGHAFVSTSSILKTLADSGVSQEQVYESLEILEDNYFIKAERDLGSEGINFFRITTYGFENFAHVFMKGFDSLVNHMLTAIVNKDLSTNKEISQHFNIPRAVTDYVLDILESRGYVQLVKTIDGSVDVLEVSAAAKRAARSL
jgi:hypothetical protein